jgi:tRNA threonylcarbamoyladenosine biosynthesis protein TsaE
MDATRGVFRIANSAATPEPRAVVSGNLRHVIEGAMERTIETRDAAETRALGAALARVARAGDLISLIGDLGSGKTQFAKGFGAGLGVTDTIVSPSFVLMAEYRGRLPMFHIDLYRLADAAEAMAGGLIDERQGDGVTLVEWAERLADAIPDGRLEILIEGTGDDPRTIQVRAETDVYRRYIEAAAEAAAVGALAPAASVSTEAAR